MPTCFNTRGTAHCNDYFVLGRVLARNLKGASRWADTPVPTRWPVELRCNAHFKPCLLYTSPSPRD
eukprot:10442455-Alexandrium_andersonii.AAC.1